ncbi:hypothetical protein C1646_699465 [Rhizophagus diaphanus]|nr:hypothetical protein C1646_699465 [Rhizophagus diaphanus] [Rhizophagus sp. MUCL 43196]
MIFSSIDFYSADLNTNNHCLPLTQRTLTLFHSLYRLSHQSFFRFILERISNYYNGQENISFAQDKPVCHSAKV